MKWFRFFDPIFSFPVIWSLHCIPVWCVLFFVSAYFVIVFIFVSFSLLVFVYFPTSRFCISVFFNCQTLKSALFVFVFVWLSPHSQGRPQARRLASPRESWPWCWATHWPAPESFERNQLAAYEVKAYSVFFPPPTFTTVSVSSSLYVVVLKCFNEARIFSSNNNILACFQIDGCDSQATPLPLKIHHYTIKLKHLLVILHIYLILI